MAFPKLNRSQLVVGVSIVFALAIVGGLTWRFGQQLVLARQMWAEEVRLEQVVVTEEARRQDLVTQLEYVKSDEYVEHWARKEVKMAKPGEVAVVPLVSAGEGPSGDEQPAATPTPEPRPFWVEWWESLFGPSD